MLTEAYISALLVDEELADQVWGLGDAGALTYETAYMAWMIIAILYRRSARGNNVSGNGWD
jgi:hypothetical protein